MKSERKENIWEEMVKFGRIEYKKKYGEINGEVKRMVENIEIWIEKIKMDIMNVELGIMGEKLVGKWKKFYDWRGKIVEEIMIECNKVVEKVERIRLRRDIIERIENKIKWLSK